MTNIKEPEEITLAATDMMRERMTRVAIAILIWVALAAVLGIAENQADFGLYVQQLLAAHSQELFGITRPLDESALGPYVGPNNELSVVAATGLKVSVVSNATHPQNDMIALWPNDENPTHLIVAVESNTSAPALQVVDLNGNPNNNV